MEPITIILILFIVSMVFPLVNLMSKIEKLQDDNDDMYTVIKEIYKDLNQVYSEIKTADSKGGFEADDEIGTTFKTIKDSIAKLESKYGEQ